MNEYSIGFIFTGSMIGLVIASMLYWIGGRAVKIIRRMGSALTLGLTVNIASFLMKVWNPWLLGIFILLLCGFAMGYGANTTIQKLIRRSLYAIAVCTSGLVFCLTLGGNAWLILPLHIGVGIWSIWLGLKNPLYAPAEEGFICVLLNLGLCAYPFIVK